jgi:hypothetical protein
VRGQRGQEKPSMQDERRIAAAPGKLVDLNAG